MSKPEIENIKAISRMTQQNLKSINKALEIHSKVVVNYKDVAEKIATSGPFTDEARQKAEQMNEVIDKVVKGMKKIKLPETAIEKVEQLADSLKDVGTVVSGVAQGLGGIGNTFSDTIYKGVDDISVDYSALSEKYRDGMVKTAEKIRPIFEELKRKWDAKKNGETLDNSAYSLTDTGIGEDQPKVSRYSLTDEEDEAGKPPRHRLTGMNLKVSSSLPAGFGTEFGAAQGQGGMGVAGATSEGMGEGMGEDGEPTGIEAQKLHNEEFLDGQGVFFNARLDMDHDYENKSTNLEKESWNNKLSAASSSAGAMSNLMQNLYVATGSKHRALFEAMKAFSIAETIIETYKSAQMSYSAFAGIPIVGPALGIVAAAAAMAAGMARVKAIKNAKPGGATGTISAGGRASPSVKGGSYNAYPPPLRLEEEQKQTQHITMNIYNPLSEQNWAEIAENNIIPALNDASERNIELTIKTVAA